MKRLVLLIALALAGCTTTAPPAPPVLQMSCAATAPITVGQEDRIGATLRRQLEAHNAAFRAACVGPR